MELDTRVGLLDTGIREVLVAIDQGYLPVLSDEDTGADVAAELETGGEVETPEMDVGQEVGAEARLGFRATVVPLGREEEPIVSVERRDALGVSSGDRVSITPLP